MPRELIKDDYVPHATIVGWGRDTQVQLGTVNTTIKTSDGSGGWWVTLDREQINRLIRVLRKARDQAYGADA